MTLLSTHPRVAIILAALVAVITLATLVTTPDRTVQADTGSVTISWSYTPSNAEDEANPDHECYLQGFGVYAVLGPHGRGVSARPSQRSASISTSRLAYYTTYTTRVTVSGGCGTLIHVSRSFTTGGPPTPPEPVRRPPGAPPEPGRHTTEAHRGQRHLGPPQLPGHQLHLPVQPRLQNGLRIHLDHHHLDHRGIHPGGRQPRRGRELPVPHISHQPSRHRPRIRRGHRQNRLPVPVTARPPS